MSLISDALKKARQEAARQDSLRQGVPYAVGSVEPPARRNPLLPLFAGLGAGCLAAGILFAVAYMAGWGPFGKPAPEARVAETAAPPAGVQSVEPAAPPTAAVVTETTETTPPSVQAAPQETPPTAPAPEEPQPQIEMRPTVPIEPPAVRPEPQATPPPSPVEERLAPAPPVPQAPPVSAAPAPEASGDLTDARVYVAELPVPGDEPVKLNGIAFSQDQPVAVLDGRVMGPGETIKGFTIVSIESGRVKLQGHGTTVFLAPK
jgi:hypothetical protein